MKMTYPSIDYRKISPKKLKSESPPDQNKPKTTPSITINGESIQTISPKKWNIILGAGVP